jgi:hypothetical protein
MSKIHPSHQSKYISVQPPTLQLSLESIYDSPHHTLYTKFKFFYDKYKQIFNLCVVLLIVGIIITIVILTSNIKSDNPCSTYFPEDYASSISRECFTYLWLKSCKRSVPNDFDGGWWLRSPNGGRMVPCRGSTIGSKCGAGSYKIISTYIYTCNLYFEGN